MSTRSEVRNKIVERLRDQTDAAERVFSNRARQLWPEELPAILVYTRNETATDFGSAPRSLQRELRMAVEVVAKADEQLDDQLDLIAQQVEDRLLGDDTLGGICSDIILTDTEMSISGEGDTLFGSAVLNFRVLYHTDVVVKDERAELADLEKINVQWDLSSDDKIEAEDTIELPTGP